MTDPLPPPLVPPDADVGGYQGFLMDADRLLNSDLNALATGDEFKAAVNLWVRAWKQRPAGSVPDDDRLLAALSGAGRRWAKVKKMALHGFVKCSDGRLYHKVLCEHVLKASAAKRERKERTSAATAARHAQRNGPRHVERNDYRDEQRDDVVTLNATFTNRNRSKEREEETTQHGHSLDTAGMRACAAAGIDPGRMAVDFVEVQRWLAAGYDIEQDILPAIRSSALRPSYSPPTTLRYFTRGIAEANRRRLEPLPHVVPRKSGNVMVGSREDIEQQVEMGLMTPDEAKAALAELGEKVRD